MPRSLISSPLIRAPLSPHAKAAVIENTTMDLDVDINPEPQQVPHAEDIYSVNTYTGKLGYNRTTLNITLVPGGSFTHAESSIFISELSWSEGDMYARGLHVAMEM